MDRKAMIKKLGEHFGVKPKYLSVPSFNYEIRTEDEVYTIDRFGIITRLDGETVTMEELLSNQIAEASSEEPENLQAAETAEAPIASRPESGLTTLDGAEIKMDMDGHTSESLKNIINMIASKQGLIMMAFETDISFMDDDFAEDLHLEESHDLKTLEESFIQLGPDRCPGFRIDFVEGTFAFYLGGAELTPEKISAFKDLCGLISEYAKTLKRVSFKPAQDDNPKYALRTWLIRIGMKGPSYQETRKTLPKHLEGSGAVRR